jgi:hypothetical protein
LNTKYEEHITETKIFHLFYMDDLKMIDKTNEEFPKQMKAVRKISDDMHMEFGLYNLNIL